MNRFMAVAAFATLIIVSAAVSAAAADETLGPAPIEYTVAHTKLGDVRGAVRSYGNVTVREFLGIRYAQPPTGSLRFSKPLPVQPWSPQTYDALSLGNWCPQSLPEHLCGPVSEDCLFLNVYAPYDGAPAAVPAAEDVQPSLALGLTEPRAVMVFVHGGGFHIGSSSQYTGAGLASVGDVVVVTINYRLNVLGFLSTSGPDSLGNYGLWDQRAAFVWVRDNVAAFGGDPKRITIFGESAGAASVHSQAISPQNDQTLFQRVIAESGSLHAPWAFQYAPLALAEGIAQKLSCPTTPSAALVECLRSKNMDELMAHAGRFGWAPSVDGEFVLDTPDVMTQKVLNGSQDPYLKNFAKYDYLVGFNSQEGLMFVDVPTSMPSINSISKNLTGKDFSDGLTLEVYSYAIKLIGQLNYCDDSSVALFVNYVKLLYETIHRQQLDSYPPDAKDLLWLFVQIVGDFQLVAPTVLMVNLHAILNGAGESYQFVYDARRSCDVPSTLSPEGPDWLRTGADHMDELTSVLAYPFLQGLLPQENIFYKLKYTDTERELSAAVIRYWTNYAKNGDPNAGAPLLKPWDDWPAYDVNKKSFLHIAINESTMQHGTKLQEDFFWNDLVATSRSRLHYATTSDARGCTPGHLPVKEESAGNCFTLNISIASIVAAFLVICIGAIIRNGR